MKHGYTIYWLLRRLSQAAVFAGFCALPWLTARGLGASGSLFALDLWGLPFADPAAALQTAICGGVSGGAKLLLGAMLALLLALALGRVFCSWICPYGLLSELVYKPARLLGRGRTTQGPARGLAVWSFAGKAALLACCILIMALWGFPLLGLISFPGELSLLPLLHWQGASLWALFGAALVPIAALLAELWTGKRLWCRFACPQSVMLGTAALILPKQVPGLRIAWQAKSCSCKKESPCVESCPMALTPRHIKGPSRRDCTLCGDCLRACAKHGGALGLRFRVNPK